MGYIMQLCCCLATPIIIIAIDITFSVSSAAVWSISGRCLPSADKFWNILHALAYANVNWRYTEQKPEHSLIIVIQVENYLIKYLSIFQIYPDHPTLIIGPLLFPTGSIVVQPIFKFGTIFSLVKSGLRSSLVTLPVMESGPNQWYGSVGELVDGLTYMAT